MANLKEIRNRIQSVASTKQITSAMKAVSASKLHKSQQDIINMKPYAEKLNAMIQNVSNSEIAGFSNPFAPKQANSSLLIVGITSNRGLCGAFNNNIIKRVTSVYNEALSSYSKVNIMGIGKKISAKFESHKYCVNTPELNHTIDLLFQEKSYALASKLALSLIDDFVNNTYSKIVLVYNAFKSSARQIVTEETLLPIAPAKPTKNQAVKHNIDWIFEPSQDLILTELLPKAIKTTFYKALLESIASEHAARMTSMHNATENATEFMKTLKLEYNKVRQAAITNEILEIVSGANALNG